DKVLVTPVLLCTQRGKTLMRKKNVDSCAAGCSEGTVYMENLLPMVTGLSNCGRVLPFHRPRIFRIHLKGYPPDIFSTKVSRTNHMFAIPA
ncbi:11048_t:CDS:2, partial [Rhizophagus irregularis]